MATSSKNIQSLSTKSEEIQQGMGDNTPDELQKDSSSNKRTKKPKIETDEALASDDTGGARSKRRRKAPNLYKDNDMNSDQLRILDQAVKNSLVENVNVECYIEEAPVFHPSLEEFQDPIKYISSIKDKASEFGICRIVPPSGWDYPMQIDKNCEKKFVTKLQKMHAMQEGRPMGDGDLFTIREYEKMSIEFKEKWIKEHYRCGEEATFQTLEADYWKVIRNHNEEMPEVEYANDLSTLEYSSGFMKRLDSDPPLGQSKALFGSPEYYRTCGWNLNNISSWPGCPIRHVTHVIDGINKPWVYHGMLFASFCWHREDVYLASINYLHEGASKQWYGVPGSKAKGFQNVLESQLKLRIKEVRDLEHHITTQLSPTTLLQNNIPVYKTIQNEGEFIVTFPQAYHCGFSYGFNIAEAVNFATTDWISHGCQSVKDYRTKHKKEVFSFDRLLFTLTYHLEDLDLKSGEVLLKELEDMFNKERLLRKQLYGSGVQDISAHTKLPKEGRMSVDIPEELANYDDQRICSNCQHTCFLSAVCCHCSESDVSCLKCCEAAYGCQCPRSNKYMLEWHSLVEIGNVIEKTKSYLKGLTAASTKSD